MSRTIEAVGDAHAAASQRRSEGRPLWDEVINLPKAMLDLDEYSNGEAIRDLAAQAAKTLRESSWVKNAPSSDTALLYAVEVLEETYDIDELNDALNQLYDLGDVDRVFITFA